MSILKNHSQRTAKVVFFYLIQRNPIVQNPSVFCRNIIKAGKQVYHRCLSASGRTDKCNFLTRFCVNADIMKNSFILPVAKRNVIKNNFAVQANKVIVCVVLPRPFAGIRKRLNQFFFAVNFCLVCIHQKNSSVICFRQFVYRTENPFCAGKSI